MFKHTKRRVIVCVLTAGMVAASSFGLSGCYGSFSLTKKLYDWNGSLDGGGIVTNIVFWALIIIPVYELLALGDFVIFNLIEYWTGSNPVAEGPAPTPEIMADGTIRIEHNGQVMEMVPIGNSHLDVYVDGALRGTVSVDANGGATIADLVTGRTANLGATDLERLQREAAPLIPAH